jgi:hypothetical protein
MRALMNVWPPLRHNANWVFHFRTRHKPSERARIVCTATAGECAPVGLSRRPSLRRGCQSPAAPFGQPASQHRAWGGLHLQKGEPVGPRPGTVPGPSTKKGSRLQPGYWIEPGGLAPGGAENRAVESAIVAVPATAGHRGTRATLGDNGSGRVQPTSIAGIADSRGW